MTSPRKCNVKKIKVIHAKHFLVFIDVRTEKIHCKFAVTHKSPHELCGKDLQIFLKICKS